MPRPRQKKRVCCNHEGQAFGSYTHHSEDVITLSTEAFEAFRLIDHEGLTQEQASLQMGVARTTVQALYQTARKSIAKAMFEGYRLIIEGGEYIMSHQGHCCHEQQRVERVAIMLKGDQVTSSYHQSDNFLVYSMDGEKINREDRVFPQGEEKAICRRFMMSLGINHVITGAMMEHVFEKFKQSHIAVSYAQGNPKEVIKAYLNKEIAHMDEFVIPSDGKDCHGQEIEDDSCCHGEKTDCSKVE